MARLSFDEFVLDPGNALLWRGRNRVSLPPKPFAVLCLLVERAGELVSKEELLDAVWSNLHVTESSLSVSINALRLALGDDSKSPRFVETVTRRGYRFIAPVVVDASSSEGVERERSGTGERGAFDPPLRPPACGRASARPQWRVGRESALAEIEGRFEQARWGWRQTVFVTGEAGIGKTTFAEMIVERFGDEAAGVLIGRCIEHFGTDEAFLPLNEALAEGCLGPSAAILLRALKERAPTWLAQLPGQIPGRDQAALRSETFGASRERMLREFCELMEALGEERPWIVILEDLHWSDYATLDVLSRFAQRTQKTAVIVVATYRPIDVLVGGHPTRAVHQELQIHGRCAEVALSKLSAAEVERYLALRLGPGALAPALAAMVRRRTGGHPLFVVSLVDYFIERGEIVEGEHGWRLAPGRTVSQEGMPHDLREMIARQIDGLSPQEQRLLEAASAVGAEFSAAAVASGMNKDPEETEFAFEELARRGRVLSADGVAEWPDGTVAGRYAFMHALYQEVLYNRLAPGRRAVLHRQLGMTLERGYGQRTSEIAAVLALHFEEGRDYGRAIRYLAEAAESSTKRFSNQEAITYLTRALGVIERLPQGEDRLSKRTELLHRRGWARRSAGDLPGSLADLAIMVACAAEAGELGVEVAGLMDLSRFSLYVERSRCLEFARQAVAKSEGLQDETMRAIVRGNCANLSLLLEGWSAEQAGICEETLRLTADSKDPRIVLRRCSIDMVTQFLTSNYRAVCVDAAAAQAMAQAIGDVYLFAIYNSLEAFALLYLGEWRLLARSATAALAMSQRNANRQAAVMCEFSLAWLQAEALDYAGAKRRAEAAIDADTERNPMNYFLARNLLLKIAVGLRDFDGALAQLQAIRRKIDVDGVAMDTAFYPQHYFTVCRYWLERGDLARAKEAATELKLFAGRQGERTYFALSHATLARIAWLEDDLDGAAAGFARAIEIVESVEIPLAAWRVYFAASEFQAFVGEAERAATLRGKCDCVIGQLAERLDEREPLRASLLRSYEAEGRRPALNPARPRSAPALSDALRSSCGETELIPDKP